MLLGGLGAGLLDFSLSVLSLLVLDKEAFAGVPGALGAGLGAAEGTGLGIGVGLGAVLAVGFCELTLPVLAGRTDPSPLAVRGAGLTEGT